MVFLVIHLLFTLVVPTEVYLKQQMGGSFNPIFENQRAYSIGALTIAPSDKNILWVGTGEGDPRNSVGYGWGYINQLMGVYLGSI